VIRADPEQDAVERIVAEIEEAPAPFHVCPHCGKVLHANAATIETLYERHRDFVRLVERLDPRGAFRNQWLQLLSWISAPSPHRARRTGPDHGACTWLGGFPVASMTHHAS
jgi:hypothetical protein